jgi:hypothetical protein
MSLYGRREPCPRVRAWQGGSGEVAREPVERIERSLTELQASGHADTPEDPVAPGEWMIALGPAA